MAAVDSADFSKTAELHKNHQKAQEQLDACELTWLEVAEELEKSTAKLATLGRD